MICSMNPPHTAQTKKIRVEESPTYDLFPTSSLLTIGTLNNEMQCYLHLCSYLSLNNLFIIPYRNENNFFSDYAVLKAHFGVNEC